MGKRGSKLPHRADPESSAQSLLVETELLLGALLLADKHANGEAGQIVGRWEGGARACRHQGAVRALFHDADH